MLPRCRHLDRVDAMCDAARGMGLFDRFRPRAQPPAPDELRRLLFDAVAAGDQALLAKLCAEHEEAVLAAFPRLAARAAGVSHPGEAAVVRPGVDRCRAAVRRARPVRADARAERPAITDEPDVRTCLLVGLAAVTADSAERTRHLHEAIELSGNLVAAAMATIMLASSRLAN
jgi:hypothetical protein